MAITFDVIGKVENGARFYSADLHVHSFGASGDVRDTTMTVEGIIDSAVRQKISVLAITDHNTDTNLDAALAHSAKYSEKLLLIPGVEITTAHGHLLAYFPPEQSRRVRDLLATLKIQGLPGSRDSHTAMSIADTVDEVERLGGLCIAAHIDREKTGFEVMVPGYPNWKKDLLARSGLYGLEFDASEHLVWYSTDDEGTPAGAERRKLTASRGAATPTAARIALAAVQNSDAHSLADFDEQHAKRSLTRLKMTDLSFEAFRLALVDPEARVRAVATIPRAFPRVLGMHLEGGFLDGCTVRFNDNLNAFIGGRGTGKSTAIRSLTYALGMNDAYEEMDNCPDTAVVYCEDSEGIKYRYERNRGREPVVSALENRDISEDMPTDSFRVESYGQGELSEVARDPIGSPELLQVFLDRHICLDDLRSREAELIEELNQNGAQLIPLEAAAAQLPAKEKELAEIDKKVRLAEAGKLKDLVTFQAGVAAEKSLLAALRELHKLYSAGVSLSRWRQEFASLAGAVGATTGDPASSAVFGDAKAIVDDVTEYTLAEEKRLSAGLADRGARLLVAIRKLEVRHRDFDRDVTARIAEFQKQGLTGDLSGFNTLLRRRSTLSGEAARIKGQAAEVNDGRVRRKSLLEELNDIREQIGERRRGQVATVNRQLRQTIDDYAINLYYERGGMRAGFCTLVQDVMRGTYFQEDAARNLTTKLSAAELVELVRKSDQTALEAVVGGTFASPIISKFRILQNLHALEVVSLPDKPVIKVVTKGSNPKQIPANQLSDGQKHTILLTIALLAESNLPLIIDQPEDDLDNAFISSSVVRTLRAVKERRQIILVTHNANIAVLGDSELILPMARDGNRGQVSERGSMGLVLILVTRPPERPCGAVAG